MENFKKVHHSCYGNICDCEDYGELTKVHPVENVEYLSELKNRELYINDDIDDWIMTEIGKRIIKWNEADKDLNVDDRKPIKIYINTDGGCLYNCMGLVSIMLSSITPIYTITMSKAFSAGSLIFLAGHVRKIYRYATVLIHEGSTFAYGSMSKAREQIEFFEKSTKVQIKNFICDRAKGIDFELYEKMYKIEWYLTAEECIKLGIAHEII